MLPSEKDFSIGDYDNDLEPNNKQAVGVRLNVYEYIWSKVFPNDELNYDEFYDWSRENASEALDLALKYCDLLQNEKQINATVQRNLLDCDYCKGLGRKGCKILGHIKCPVCGKH